MRNVIPGLSLVEVAFCLVVEGLDWSLGGAELRSMDIEAMLGQVFEFVVSFLHCRIQCWKSGAVVPIRGGRLVN